jgi:hypothetical protein
MKNLVVITGYEVLGEILRRNHRRAESDRVARQLGISVRTHRARLGDREFVESNLPLPNSRFENRDSKISP